MRHRRHRLLLTISEFMFSSQVRNICDLVSRIDRDEFEVEIGALRIDDEAADEITALGVRFFKFRLIPTRDMLPHDFATLARSPITLAHKDYDVVHSLLYQSVYSEAWLVKKLTKAKYVYTKSNLEWSNHPGQWTRKSRLSDCIISISDATSRLLAEHGFADRTEKIYLGIDTDTFKPSESGRARYRAAWRVPPKATTFGCAAQFMEIKEHLTVIRAFETVADSSADVYLLLCGPNHDDAYYHSCLAYIASSRHRPRIKLLGTLRDMPGFFSAIDVFVLPSRFEAFGYSFVEAMSCERPAIGCNAGGPAEIIEDGRTGFFSKMSDPVDLADYMGRYAASPELVRQHGSNARQRVVRTFSSAAMAEKCQELYFRLLAEEPESPSVRRSAKSR